MTILWIPLTIAAAFLQNVRSALQKHLKGELGTTGATFVRFGYGFPFALLYLAGLSVFTDLPVPQLNAPAVAPVRSTLAEYYSPPGLLGQRNGLAMIGSLGTLRTVKPF